MTCHHVWIFNASGSAIFLHRHCYSRPGAQAALRRGIPGRLTDQKPAVTLRCLGSNCPCWTRCQRKETP